MSPADSGATGDGDRRFIEIEDASAERLDRFLCEPLALSRTRVAQLIAAGHVTVNGRATRKGYLPRGGDRIEVHLPPAVPTRLEPEDIPVEIRYEDEHLAVVEKPAGLVVHPAPGHPRGTLVNALLFHLDGLSNIGGDRRPGIVHRLDRDTSGLMLVAKRDGAHRRLSAALRRREVERGYLAAAWGHLERDRFTVDRPIGRDRRNRKRMAVREAGRPATTHFRRLERWNAADLVAVRLGTGRTHQVRVHLRSVGHPVVADPIYAPGWERGFGGAGGRWAGEFRRRAARLFLHAAHLAFEHPVTGEELSFASPLPSPLLEVVEWARTTS